jgi:hypothetical protein
MGFVIPQVDADGVDEIYGEDGWYMLDVDDDIILLLMTDGPDDSADRKIRRHVDDDVYDGGGIAIATALKCCYKKEKLSVDGIERKYQ